MHTRHFAGSILVAIGLGTAAAPALAQVDGAEPIAIPNLAVRERLQEMEQINVTSHKEPEAINEAWLLEILDDAEALEAPERTEQTPSD